MTAALKEQLLQLTMDVERALSLADYALYRRYVDPAASFFEPRSLGFLLQGAEGEAFEKFYFDNAAVSKPSLSEVSAGRQSRVNVVDSCIHILDDQAQTACVAYVCSVQHFDPVSGESVTRKTFNTRLWVQDDNGHWKCIHYHRS